MSNAHHLVRYKLADLFLDTSPYGAHTAASDALWMGVPVLTVAGRGFAARVCASLVHGAGLGELICSSSEEYISRAIDLARDSIRLRALRDRLLANRDRCTLFDAPDLAVC
jgi:predicted O-linked N-acetylglucosamine transferase (SPINDLY family)